MGLAQPKPTNIQPSNFTFKPLPDSRKDTPSYSPLATQVNPRYNRSQSGDNPLMRKLTPNHSRSVSRDIGIKDPRANLEYHLGPANYTNETSQNYMSAQKSPKVPITPLKQVNSQQNVGAQLTLKEQPPMLQPHPLLGNNYLKSPSGAPLPKNNQMDYRISNHILASQESKGNISANNLSAEIFSNDQSRIKPGQVLKLRSDSPGIERSHIGNFQPSPVRADNPQYGVD